MADTSVNTLLEASKCYACLSPGMWPLIELALLQQIVDAGGGGGGGGGTGTGGAGMVGVGSPEGVATATPGTSYFDTATDNFWYKKTGSGSVGWVQEIGP